MGQGSCVCVCVRVTGGASDGRGNFTDIQERHAHYTNVLPQQLQITFNILKYFSYDTSPRCCAGTLCLDPRPSLRARGRQRRSVGLGWTLQGVEDERSRGPHCVDRNSGVRRRSQGGVHGVLGQGQGGREGGSIDHIRKKLDSSSVSCDKRSIADSYEKEKKKNGERLAKIGEVV